MAAAVDNYAYTATGVLGDKRPTMLENTIHQRPQLSRSRSHCHHVPEDMTMGMSTNRDPNALPKVFSWNDSNQQFQSLLSRPKQCGQKDFVAMNREAVKSGYASLRENRDFRQSHEYRMRPAAVRNSEDHQQQGRRLPANMTYGISTRPTTPIHELMANKFQDEWINDRLRDQQVKSASTPKKPLLCQPFETRASLLRTFLVPAESPALWKIPRFERRARPQLNTFRSARCRQLALELREAERSDRLGSGGLGLYIPSTK